MHLNHFYNLSWLFYSLWQTIQTSHNIFYYYCLWWTLFLWSQANGSSQTLKHIIHLSISEIINNLLSSTNNNQLLLPELPPNQQITVKSTTIPIHKLNVRVCMVSSFNWIDHEIQKTQVERNTSQKLLLNKVWIFGDYNQCLNHSQQVHWIINNGIACLQ